jgi:hypothetical protein
MSIREDASDRCRSCARLLGFGIVLSPAVSLPGTSLHANRSTACSAVQLGDDVLDRVRDADDDKFD